MISTTSSIAPSAFPVVSPAGVPARIVGGRSGRRAAAIGPCPVTGRRSPGRRAAPGAAREDPGAGTGRNQTTILVPVPPATGDSARTPAPMAPDSSETMARPSPDPFRLPPLRSEVKWRSKTRGSWSGRDARPVVHHPQGGHARRGCRPPR